MCLRATCHGKWSSEFNEKYLERSVADPSKLHRESTLKSEFLFLIPRYSATHFFLARWNKQMSIQHAKPGNLDEPTDTWTASTRFSEDLLHMQQQQQSCVQADQKLAGKGDQHGWKKLRWKSWKQVFSSWPCVSVERPAQTSQTRVDAPPPSTPLTDNLDVLYCRFKWKSTPLSPHLPTKTTAPVTPSDTLWQMLQSPVNQNHHHKGAVTFLLPSPSFTAL